MALGLRGTLSWGADERPKSYREEILYLMPNSAPLTALTNRTQQEATTDSEYKWFTKDLPTQRAQVEGAQTSGETAIEVETGQGNVFKAGHVIMNERTLEIMWVTVDPAADTLTVVRGKGPVAGTAMNDADGLIIIGSAHEEGSAAPTAVYYNPVVNSNYTQIFKNAFYLTKSGESVELRTGRSKVEAKRETLELHAIEIERALLWGGAIEDTSGAQAKRTTKGVFNFITTNVKDFADAVTIDDWENFMEDCFEDGSQEKAFFTGNRAINVLGKLARNHTQLTSAGSETVYGVKFEKWRSSFGELYVLNHPLFSKNPTFNDWGFVVDMKYIKYRYLRDRDTQYQENIQTPDLDALKNQFLTDCGLEVQHQSTCGVAKNMSAFAA